MNGYDRVFNSVFPPTADVVVPTPQATPVLGSSAFGEPFSSPQLPHDSGVFTEEGYAAEQVQWDRAWSTATSFLSIAGKPVITNPYGKIDRAQLDRTWFKPYGPEVASAFSHLLSEESRGWQLRRFSSRHDLLLWYTEEVCIKHFLHHVKPTLSEIFHDNLRSKQTISAIVNTLHSAQYVYIHPLSTCALPYLSQERKKHFSAMKTRLQYVFRESVPHKKLAIVHRNIFTVLVSRDLDSDDRQNEDEWEDAKQADLQLLQNLHEVGLGGAAAERSLAEVMTDYLSRHVEASCAGRWSSPSTVKKELIYWTDKRFASLTLEILMRLREAVQGQTEWSDIVPTEDIHRWQDAALDKLGALRTEELFDIVIQAEDTQGAIEDLRPYVKKPAFRAHVINTFCAALSQRLLQPGASTTEILQVYISIIRTFNILDPKGVLLDHVARPIRRYLQDRDDTVSIVVGGLLSSPQGPSNGPEILSELSEELDKTLILSATEEQKAGELDWDDMEWNPDPVDAGPDFQRAKHSDVIGALISLFDNRGTFIREFQNILGDRLLKHQHDFAQESRVLELLKARFGEPALQACEVMMRDIQDSQSVDAVIMKKQRATSKASPLQPAFHTKTLSRLFWPTLPTSSFILPAPIAHLQESYSTAFEAIKQSRKLTWLPAVGQVTVKINLEDRTLVEEVGTWQASVIYAFSDSDASGAATRTVNGLAEQLEMEEELVRDALTFWVGKMVLVETGPSVYTVLETLPSATGTNASMRTSSGKPTNPSLLPTKASAGLATSAATASASISASTSTSTTTTALRPPSSALKPEKSKKMDMYWQFIKGMLTNQGPMNLQRIVMMLKIVIPGGFPFGNEALKEFLEGRMQAGEVDYEKGNWKIKR